MGKHNKFSTSHVDAWESSIINGTNNPANFEPWRLVSKSSHAGARGQLRDRCGALLKKFGELPLPTIDNTRQVNSTLGSVAIEQLHED